MNNTMNYALNNSPSEEFSDLCYIDLKSDDPYDLFNDWYKEACKFSTGLPAALCLATVSKDLKVSARHVVLRRIEEDGFVVYTDNRSRKAKELTENPAAAMCFLWAYVNDKNQRIARQVRIEGDVVVADKESIAKLYEKDKLFAKIRSYICPQDQEVDWGELKAKHDKLLNEVRLNKKSLPMPDHYVGYKLVPTAIEFYYARDTLIGDRILFERDSPSSSWMHKRIAA
ncbi:pyridoxine/pyridoxamine 5'-phosphate oxidase-like isoform X2 [Phymastichus coffea]|nr:pyridoxine/pyridoxamine 5'-phosphate oxidase-like isoform X2 [Phymastichus coffea]XP_058801120.1 pyridoxine/pyridoxamine 5'-phosphate oxidase-like isoform X2 [Phymastichus coffea]XP_058801121.1 pyridoxine/pyridoxamine 5'-phosphate oxidase-like isoform X2 [Phymastichus coffea]XP_058801122.1 pyridoxine/pyridoxamine 5'-phosphate oxidase-like isoform X2 [Phymastichus coffea]XP_058801123.1 pyridoxine/pyridoxamine 5'-phosphate oxidase-like isoform X2 [Phymastichus coffea]